MLARRHPHLTRKGEEEQQGNYTGTIHGRTVFIENAGHLEMLDRAVPVLRSVVTEWLCALGLAALVPKHASAA